jgi:hypothetical protein
LEQLSSSLIVTVPSSIFIAVTSHRTIGGGQMTPSLQRKVQQSTPHMRDVGIPLPIGDPDAEMAKNLFATACHRLPTIPFLLERESTSWLRKEIESREPEGPQDSTSTLTGARS